MMRFTLRPWLILALCVAPLMRGAADPAGKMPAAGHFLAADAIDWKTVLPPPPAIGSVAALADVETVLQVQAARTPADVAWAKLVEQDKVFADYADVLGPWFDAKNFPVLAEFLHQVTGDAQAANKRFKNLYPRARPPVLEPTVQPCVPVPPSNSYPSGHSLRAYVWAEVLGDVFPDRKVDLYAQAHHVAWARVIGGVHFPSDTIGGRIAARAIVAELRKSPAYRAAIERCRAEAAPFLHKKAA